MEGTSPDSEYISESPSSFELHYINLFVNEPQNPHLTITLDFTVSWKFNSADIWRTFLLNLILINPELRTIFQKTEPGLKRADTRRCVLDIEDVCFDFFTVSSHDELQKVFKEISTFDPYIDIPIKAIFWNAQESGALRLLFNHCSIDNGSFSTIVKDLVYIMKHYLIHGCSPQVNVRESLDPALLIENHMNEEEELKSFWTTELSKCEESQSFEVLEAGRETTGTPQQNDAHELREVTPKHRNSGYIITQRRKSDSITTSHWNGDQNANEGHTKHWNATPRSNNASMKHFNDDKEPDNAIIHLSNGQKAIEVTNQRSNNHYSFDVISKRWGADAFQKLEVTSKNNNFTMFSLFCTAFQLTLSKQLQCERICLINAVDTRLHVPELHGRIGLCVNYIPLISPDLTNPESTLHTVLTENKMIIANGISKSLFPFQQTKELPSFSNDIHMAHSIVMEDLNQWTGNESQNIRLTKFGVQQDPTYETYLSVITHPAKSFELRLLYSVGKVGRHNAENVLENIEEILMNMVSNLNMKIHTWQPTCKQEKAIEGLTHCKYCVVLCVTCFNIIGFVLFDFSFPSVILFYSCVSFLCS
jgi:hypothetical protein